MDFVPTELSRVRRKADRAAYDEASVYGVLDAGLIAHVGYVLDGVPVVTPTAYWRVGRWLYWHGAGGSRALATQGAQNVCVTVSHTDGLVVSRSGFTHSLLYRSVVAFGRAKAVTDPAAKAAAMTHFLERLYPGRTATLRPSSERELAMITVMSMEIEEASAKIRGGGVTHQAEDADWSVWSGVIPIETRLGAPIPDETSAQMPIPGDLARYQAGARLDEALLANR